MSGCFYFEDGNITIPANNIAYYTYEQVENGFILTITLRSSTEKIKVNITPKRFEIFRSNFADSLSNMVLLTTSDRSTYLINKSEIVSANFYNPVKGHSVGKIAFRDKSSFQFDIEKQALNDTIDKFL